MSTPGTIVYNTAVEDFKRARRSAAMQQMMARLTGESADLLAYDDVCRAVKSSEGVKQGVYEISLDAIVGSVGRYQDFTRTFWPKHDSDEERWVRVKTAVNDMVGMPPIDVYKVGEVYFVIDGNHRVSIARQLGSDSITARVTEVPLRVPLSPDDNPDELICKARYAEFLERTNLDMLRPKADLLLTFCGQYHQLLDQIEAHADLLAQRGAPVDTATAVCRWYDEVYLPVLRHIQAQGIMRLFPERTSADMYILFSERRAELESELGWEIEPETAVSDLVTEKVERPKGFAGWLQSLVPPELVEGPAPGRWREFQATRAMGRLFADYLVSIRGSETDWQMLDEVVRLAQRDNDRLLGLHVVPHEKERSSAAVAKIRERFLQTCADAGLVGEFAVEAGAVRDTIIKRAAFADLVVLNLAHPPGPQPRERLGNRFSQLVQRCPRPILAVPSGATIPMERALLAYDGSPKADEALFVTTYLASRWPLSLTVVTVETEYTSSEALERAQAYLEEHGVFGVQYVLCQLPIAESVLETAVDHDIDFLIMGGFGFRPMMHLMLGSSVDTILRQFQHPILICR
ncbi:MAG: universal stress protein [Anaerolineales bacterium]|nr:universal stress protein [Anaerolineales bacterium]MCB8937178.1 universal stress protein [Ardenticatenaceae bacterium]